MFLKTSKKQQEIYYRVLEVANYMLKKENATIRKCAEELGVSKSTVHKDIRDRLQYINPQLQTQVISVLEKNASERHIRGGNATRNKYKGDVHYDKHVWCENG